MSSSGPLPEDPHPTSPKPEQQPTMEEFQFLQCQNCQEEAKCPKLLPCLHSVCSGCLEMPDLQCPVCKMPGPAGIEPSALDNVFFESLQRRLSIYRKIMDEMALCTRCKEAADFWCSECEQLLCALCSEAHQWFLVKHEPRPLGELRNLSEFAFLDSLRKTNNSFCSHPEHRGITTNIYCRGCAKPMCSSCAVLDEVHKDLKCDIREEIKQRQEELDSVTYKLREKKEAFGAALEQVHSNFSQLHQQHTDTKELIRSIFGQVVALVQAQERQLLEKANRQYECNYQKLADQQQHLDTVLHRIRTGSTLVQKMKCYASDQEVLDMHDNLRKALHCLDQEKPSGTDAIVCMNVSNELKACQQHIVSGITQVIDAEVSRRENSEATNLPQNCLDVDLTLQDNNESSHESSDVQLEGPSSLQTMDGSLADPGTEDKPLVFFDLKIDNETQKISQLAALNGDNKFRVLITPKTCLSGRTKRVSLDEGLKHFLNFLRSMHRPILACYKLWGPSLPNFFRALTDLNQLGELQEATSGFLAILPLIRERVPGASSFQLSHLASTYLARNMNEGSALASVLAMRDLCHLLEVSQGPYLIPYIHSFGNLHCFASLKPLVQAAVLPRPEARLLALHNVGFLELLRAYRWNPQGALKKYNHYLSLLDFPTQRAERLQALKCYFESILQSSASTL